MFHYAHLFRNKSQIRFFLYVARELLATANLLFLNTNSKKLKEEGFNRICFFFFKKENNGVSFFRKE